jgi:hypothetical protein
MDQLINTNKNIKLSPTEGAPGGCGATEKGGRVRYFSWRLPRRFVVSDVLMALDASYS